MQIPNRVVEGIQSGRVTRVYRRWDRPRAVPGGTQLTRLGLIGIVAVEEVASIEAITDADAQASGEADRAALVKWLDLRPELRIYQITVCDAGPDPRHALRAALPDDAELTALDAKLDRLDRTRPEPWTRPILVWIRDHPAVVSKELAVARGLDPATELQPMKTDIRKMKALGLTISLEVGYRLAPRGEVYLDWWSSRQQ